jgi:hypothetical protein
MIWHLSTTIYGGVDTSAQRGHAGAYPVTVTTIAVWLVSGKYRTKGLKLKPRILNVDATEIFRGALDAAADSTAKSSNCLKWTGCLQPISGSADNDAGGKLGRTSTGSPRKRDHRLGEVKLVRDSTESYAGYTALSQLPKVKATFPAIPRARGTKPCVSLEIQRECRLFRRRKVNKGGAERVLPAIMNNYISLYRVRSGRSPPCTIADLGGASRTLKSRGGMWSKRDDV